MNLLCWRWPIILEVILVLPFCIAIHFVPREHFNVKVKHRNRKGLHSASAQNLQEFNEV